jgi:hypothetical protein
MKGVDTIARIRREFFIRGRSTKEICRALHVPCNTVRKLIRSGTTAPTYERTVQPLPKLGPWQNELDRLLSINAARSQREHLTLMKLGHERPGIGNCHAILQAEGLCCCIG